MASAEQLITKHLDTWSSTIKAKSSAGRGSSKKQQLYGIKKLRELILELAIRGLIVSQDPNDESAVKLLKRIAKEKAQLEKEGKIKKPKQLPSISEYDKLFSIPKNWAWAQLGQIAESAPRNVLSDDLDASFIPMPLISTSYKGSHEQEIRKWSEIKKGYTHFADGDIAIAKITPCFENSKAAIFNNLQNGYGAGTTELHVARLIGDYTNSRFILLYLKAPMFLEKGKPKMTGSAGQKRIPASYFISNPLPLPPLAEQHRIVAKVDELMALCDQLEQQQTDSMAAHATLVTALLGALTTASEQGQFDSAWQRIAANFDSLFTTESSIDQLKQTILQLAVMGKLVGNNETLKEVRFEDVVELQHGFQFRKHDFVTEDGIPVIKIGQCKPDGTLDLTSASHISKERKAEFEHIKINKGDILMALTGGTLGKVTVVQNDYGFVVQNYRVGKFIPSDAISSGFIALVLKSPLFRKLVFAAVNQNAQPNIGKANINKLRFPLPSLDQQHRIVAKVDELMALCDQLKANLKAAQEIQLNLANSLVEEAIA